MKNTRLLPWYLLAGLVVLRGFLATLPPPHVFAADNDPTTITQATVSGYYPDSSKAAFRSAVGIIDTTTTPIASITSAVAGRFRVNGRKTIAVSARFSAASQTCKYRLVYESFDGTSETVYELSDEQTLTGTTIADGSGKFMSNVVELDSHAATYLRVLITASAVSGTEDIWVGSR